MRIGLGAPLGLPFNTALIWDLSGRELTHVTQPKAIHSIAFSADRSRIATAGADKTARVWEPNA